MKKITSRLLLPLAALLCLFAKCEDDDISPDALPAAVRNYLNTNYPGFEIEALETDTLCTGTAVVEVEIEAKDDTEIEMTFDTEGTLVFTSTEIKVSALPAAVSASMASLYPGFSVKEAERCDMNGGGTRYEIEIKNGNDVREIWAEADGTVVCESVETDDDDE